MDSKDQLATQVRNSWAIWTAQPTMPDSLSAVALVIVACLSIHVVSSDETDDLRRVVTTVFELAGQDQSGLLADVTHLLTTNGCDVRSAAVRHGSQLFQVYTLACFFLAC